MSRPVLFLSLSSFSLLLSGINRGAGVGDSGSEGARGSVGGARRRREGPSSTTCRSSRWAGTFGNPRSASCGSLFGFLSRQEQAKRILVVASGPRQGKRRRRRRSSANDSASARRAASSSIVWPSKASEAWQVGSRFAPRSDDTFASQSVGTFFDSWTDVCTSRVGLA